MVRLSPCEVCGDEPYLTGGCTHQGKEAETVTPQEVLDAFNRICTTLPGIKKITERRRDHIRARGATLSEFEQVFHAVDTSEFLSGRNKEWAGCGFDWIIRPNNWQKILEGNYSRESIRRKPLINPAVDYPQKRYSDIDLAHLFVNLDGDGDDQII
jgi:hypothetical protein